MPRRQRPSAADQHAQALLGGSFIFIYFSHFYLPIFISHCYHTCVGNWSDGVFCSQGERTPRPSKTSPTSSDEMAHQMATPTIHEGIAQAMSLGGIARPMQVDRPKRVLLVDDDRLVRMVLAALLRR